MPTLRQTVSKKIAIFSLGILSGTLSYARDDNDTVVSVHAVNGLALLGLVVVCLMLIVAIYFLIRVKAARNYYKKTADTEDQKRFAEYIQNLDSTQDRKSVV